MQRTIGILFAQHKKSCTLIRRNCTKASQSKEILMILEQAYDAVDLLNKQDPISVFHNGITWPAELLYGIRMTQEIEQFRPESSDSLKVAVRAQHIGRWLSPRSNYPMDKAGYTKWRTELYGIHAELAGKQLKDAGFVDSFTRLPSLGSSLTWVN